MGKMIDGHWARSFGNENTNLRWSDFPRKVSALIESGDGHDIWEREVDLEDEDGSITERTYLYAIWNTHERHVSWDRPEWLSLDDLIARLSEEADEIAGEASQDYFWNLDGWGNEYPPENADEIINKANAAITEAAVAHYWDKGFDIGDFAAALWDRYCTTGEI